MLEDTLKENTEFYGARNTRYNNTSKITKLEYLLKENTAFHGVRMSCYTHTS